MTTNKPEVVAWIWDYRGRHMATTDYSQALELAEPPYPTEVEPLIRLADYQRLQADTERLQAECEEELFCVRQDRDTHFGEMMRAIEQVDAMKAECEKLRNLLRHAQPIIKAHAEASHMLEGFRPRRNQWDELVDGIHAAMQETSH